MAAKRKGGTAVDAAAIPLADGGVENGAVKGSPPGEWPTYNWGRKRLKALEVLNALAPI